MSSPSAGPSIPLVSQCSQSKCNRDMPADSVSLSSHPPDATPGSLQYQEREGEQGREGERVGEVTEMPADSVALSSHPPDSLHSIEISYSPTRRKGGRG